MLVHQVPERIELIDQQDDTAFCGEPAKRSCELGLRSRPQSSNCRSVATSRGTTVSLYGKQRRAVFGQKCAEASQGGRLPFTRPAKENRH